MSFAFKIKFHRMSRRMVDSHNLENILNYDFGLYF